MFNGVVCLEEVGPDSTTYISSRVVRCSNIERGASTRTRRAISVRSFTNTYRWCGDGRHSWLQVVQHVWWRRRVSCGRKYNVIIYSVFCDPSVVEV